MGKLAYLTITALIKLNNNILYGMTWLKRKVKELGLCMRRRGALKRYSPDSLIRAVVQVSFIVYPSAYNFHLQAELKTANSLVSILEKCLLSGNEDKLMRVIESVVPSEQKILYTEVYSIQTIQFTGKV